ncbi:MAG TPA: hypothetical protein VII49_09390 [Rhizomicrobium sp.]
MTKLLDSAIVRVRDLPDSEQDAAAELLLEFADQPARSLLSEEQADEVRLSLQELREGRVVSQDELTALWRKFDR